MKQFAVIAYDAKDEGAYERRLSARPEHIKGLEAGKANGSIIAASAILDDNDKMVGSVILAQFPTRAELDAWVAAEPFSVNKVWGDITVHNCRMAAAFSDLIKQV